LTLSGGLNVFRDGGHSVDRVLLGLGVFPASGEGGVFRKQFGVVVVYDVCCLAQVEFLQAVQKPVQFLDDN